MCHWVFTHHVWSEGMNLHTVFVGDDFASGRSRVSANDDAVLEDGPADGRASLGGLRQAHAPIAQKKSIPEKKIRNC